MNADFLDIVLASLWRVAPTPEFHATALDVQARDGFGFHDALVIASALAGGCTRLLSEDLQHSQRIGDLTIVDPFRKR